MARALRETLSSEWHGSCRLCANVAAVTCLCNVGTQHRSIAFLSFPAASSRGPSGHSRVSPIRRRSVTSPSISDRRLGALGPDLVPHHPPTQCVGSLGLPVSLRGTSAENRVREGRFFLCYGVLRGSVAVAKMNGFGSEPLKTQRQPLCYNPSSECEPRRTSRKVS